MAELEKLLLKLEVDTLQLRRALKDAETGVESYTKKSSKNFGTFASSARDGAEAVGAALRYATGALAAYATATKALEAVSAAAAIDRDAKAAGLATDEYQELAFAVGEIGIQMNEFNGMAGQFASSMGELRAQTGGFYDFLSAHLPTVRDQISATKSVGEAYRVVADTVRRLSSDEERATFIAKAFGEEGRKLSVLFAGGAKSLDEAAAKARQLGIVLSDDLIAGAVETEKEFNKLVRTLETRFQSAVVGAANAVQKLWGEGQTLGIVMDGVKGHETLEQLRAAAEKAKSEYEALRKVAETPPSQQGLFEYFFGNINPATERAEAFRKRLEEINAQITKLDGERAKLDEAAAAIGTPGAAGDQGPLKLAPKRDPIGDWQTSIDTRGVEAMRRLQMQRLAAVEDTTGLIRANYEAELAEFERLLDEKLISESDFATARASLNEIASRQVADHIEEENERMQDSVREITDAIEDGISAPLYDAFAGNMKSADDYFKALLRGLAEATTQALILKPLMDYVRGNSGSWATALSSGFGGGFAGGGMTAPGKSYVVGEKGPEIFTPGVSGRVHPNDVSFGGSQGKGASITYNIDARGADTGVEQRIMSALAAAEARRPSAVQTLADTRRRFPTRG